MKFFNSPSTWRIVPLLALVAGLTMNGRAAVSGDNGKAEFISLRDFAREEVKGAGFTLAKETAVTVTATGGADKSFWDTFNDSDENRSGLYAGGWIIDAKTRRTIWEMTRNNTSGTSAARHCAETVTLKPGAYEVYFAAYGYASSSGLSQISANIDRREPARSHRRDVGTFFKELFGYGEDFVEAFMDHAKNDWGIALSVDEPDRSGIALFNAPQTPANVLLSTTRIGDGAMVRKTLTVPHETDVRVYAIGEGRGTREMFDYAWITNTVTRERVWRMDHAACEQAGGAAKNVRFDGTVHLPAGTYEMTYISDGSHSCDDWNAMPPHDPFNYGITIMALGEKTGITVAEPESIDKNVVVSFTKMRNDDLRTAGFTLTAPANLRIYALGESHGEGRAMADYGWIVNARTHERVWTMEESRTEHAGGATKNRMIDEIITLPAGSYIASYQTDDTHAYGDWNDDAPFDPEHWGMTICGPGKEFDPSTVKSFSGDQEEGVVAQIIRVRDDRDLTKSFSLGKETQVRIYALGESDGREMADHGWIENAKTGDIVWEMTYRSTEHAGGAKKNRIVNRILTLPKGDYELRYKSDGSHSYGDWNDDPPEDPVHWGITLYKKE